MAGTDKIAGKKILFVSDNPVRRIPLSQYLRELGYDVCEVFYPSQAIEAISGGQFDIILLQIVTDTDPKAGEKVLSAMKKKEIKTPVILTTYWGYNGPPARAKNDFPDLVRKIISEPTPEELRDAITEILGASI